METIGTFGRGFIVFWRSSQKPWLCVIHVVGFIAVLTPFLYQVILLDMPRQVALLPVFMLVQYVVSVRYHWLVYDHTRARIDRVMIAVLVAMTAVPYWLTQFSFSESWWRFAGLILLTAATCWMVWRHNDNSKGLIPIGYLSIGLYGIVVSWPYIPIWLCPYMLRLFWAGVIFYLISHGFLLSRWPRRDQLYRIPQHISLIPAFVLHIIVLTELY